MDYVTALELVFFTSLPLVAAVHFLRLALKRETIGTSRTVCWGFGFWALVFTLWVSFQKGEWVCADALTLLFKRSILLVLLFRFYNPKYTSLYSHICFCKQIFSSDEKLL